MARKGRIRKVSGVMLALLLAVGQLLMGGADVQAASKQKELNITALSLSVGQSPCVYPGMCKRCNGRRWYLFQRQYSNQQIYQ